MRRQQQPHKIEGDQTELDRELCTKTIVNWEQGWKKCIDQRKNKRAIKKKDANTSPWNHLITHRILVAAYGCVCVLACLLACAYTFSFASGLWIESTNTIPSQCKKDNRVWRMNFFIFFSWICQFYEFVKIKQTRKNRQQSNIHRNTHKSVEALNILAGCPIQSNTLYGHHLIRLTVLK